MTQAFARCTPHPAPAPTTTNNAPAALGHNAALRQLANRLVGILHGCLKTRTLYDEATAWSHHNQDQRRRLTFKLLGCLPGTDELADRSGFQQTPQCLG